jgi:formylglycine-generating enzyme required for sulfatase activity
MIPRDGSNKCRDFGRCYHQVWEEDMHRFVRFIFGLSLLACTLCGLALGQPLSPERERALNPKDTFSECDICPEMVVVPAGSFTMGSPDSEKGRNSWEGPQHVVTFARPFAVGKFEVTVDQFAAFVRDTRYDAGSNCWTFENGKVDGRSGRSWRNPGFSQDGSHPASCLSWHDAKAYVEWLSKKTEKAYRLLTEAEWEFAARAKTSPGSGPRYGFGDDDKAICANGNGLDQTAKRTIGGTGTWEFLACSDDYAYTAPAGKFSANGFGLHDMLGNVKEWTADCYREGQGYRDAPTDGSAWTLGDCHSRVLRGGSWLSYSRLLRTAFRHRSTTDGRVSDVGFRVARTFLTP